MADERDHLEPSGGILPSDRAPALFNPASRPTGIGANCVVSLTGQPMVQLVVNGPDDRVLMESTQDLEDTFALGTFIVEATADIVEALGRLLKDAAWRDGLGEDFESYLDQAEAATRRIRLQLSASDGTPESDSHA